MTLIEITVAIAVVGVMFASVVVGIGALTGSKARAATGELAGVIRSLYDTASLTGKTCRLVFDLGETRSRDDDPPAAAYWAECAAGAVTAGRDRDPRTDAAAAESQSGKSGAKRERPTRSMGFGSSPSLQDLSAQERDRIEQAATFSEFTSPEITKRKLPGSVKLSVWTRHQTQEATQGRAFLYFFPQGFTERAMIFVSQGGNSWTVTVAPLTGKATIVGDRLEVPRS